MSRLVRLIVAIVVGLVLAFSAFFIGFSSGKGQGTSLNPVEAYSVSGQVAAGVTLADAVASGALVPQTYPALSLPSDYVGPESGVATDTVFSFDLSAGQIVTRSMLVSAASFNGDSGYSPDETLVSVDVTIDGAVAGLLKPGDIVAVYGVTSGQSAALLVPRARVVLLGEANAEAGATSPSTYVTMAVTQPEAETIISALASQTIHLALLGK